MRTKRIEQYMEFIKWTPVLWLIVVVSASVVVVVVVNANFDFVTSD